MAQVHRAAALIRTGEVFLGIGAPISMLAVDFSELDTRNGGAFVPTRVPARLGTRQWRLHAYRECSPGTSPI